MAGAGYGAIVGLGLGQGPWHGREIGTDNFKLDPRGRLHKLLSHFVTSSFSLLLFLKPVMESRFTFFLVADTRLYTLPCRSVRPPVRHIFEL